MGFIKTIHEDGREEFVNENYEELKAFAEKETATPIVITEEEERTLYKVQRSNDYPRIAEQLDKLFHDIDAGKLDKTGTFYTAIKAIKDANPKPS